jgi:hypothetical protein
VHEGVSDLQDALARAKIAMATTKRASSIFIGVWTGTWLSEGLPLA